MECSSSQIEYYKELPPRSSCPPTELEALGDELAADTDASYLDDLALPDAPTKEPGKEAHSVNRSPLAGSNSNFTGHHQTPISLILAISQPPIRQPMRRMVS